MSITFLPADASAELELQRLAAAGLPIPPSWNVPAKTVRSHNQSTLAAQLHALPSDFDDYYWVLQQGPMNPDSQRESLLNLDSDASLASALATIFNRDNAPQSVVIQALPKQVAAGVLFTRHPLRQDLSHIVVEGIESNHSQTQRLVYDDAGRLIHAPDNDATLHAQVGNAFGRLNQQLRDYFSRPQAAEWVYDGGKLWLLQSLPIGSLPDPQEAWSRRAGVGLFAQAVTPLWYTLAGRWLKTAFWEPLVKKSQWETLQKVEPYRRQHSHLYANSAFFRELQHEQPTAAHALPPAWRTVNDAADAEALPSHWQYMRHSLSLCSMARELSRWSAPPLSREALWRSVMRLDALGERLGTLDGWLSYRVLPQLVAHYDAPLPLVSLLTPQELQTIEQVKEGNSEALKASALRPGVDPVHAPLKDGPAQAMNLRGSEIHLEQQRPPADVQSEHARWFTLARSARGLRFALANRLRSVLTQIGGVAAEQGLLAHPDDVFFLYFDELWQLWMREELPASANQQAVGERKVRYLEDSLKGAPDWKIDQIGYGFGGGQKQSALLWGESLVAGNVTGTVRRLCSAWGLNKITPGDIVIVDQVDPAWLPWLLQVGGLVVCNRDPANAAASFALAHGIPAIWNASDVIHSVYDDQGATLDATAGRLHIA